MSATNDSIVRLALAGIQAAIAESAVPGSAYVLILGTVATDTPTIYASNLEREGAIETLEEVLDSLRKGTITPGGITVQ